MRHGVGRRNVLAAAGAALAAPAVVRAQGATSGVALVIGNSKYKWEAPLPNVKRDVPDVARCFQTLGLKTELLQDAGRDAMRQAIDKFAAASDGAKLAAFYFAGHGVIAENAQHLVPLDADLNNPDSLKEFPFAAVFRIVKAMAKAEYRLLALDCCRNNPSDGWRQQQAANTSFVWKGSTDPNDLPNTMVLFSTAPGRSAVDGPPGEYSPFVLAFLRQFEGPSVELHTLPRRLRRDLLLATQGRQVLFDRNNYRQPFVIAGVGSSAPRARAGWNDDPSRIIDLTNAYAYAQENGLPLPRGLIAHRPPGGSHDSRKAGAFKFFRGNEPSLIVVLSVEEQQAAEVVMASRIVGSGRAFWTFIRGTLSGDGLDVLPTSHSATHTFRWSDANSGSVTIVPAANDLGSRILTSRFTRLD